MSDNAYPLVSIIALNWNTTQVTCDFLQSIQTENTYPNIEVIIVDNNSSEDPTAAFKNVLPSVMVVRNVQNLGFSGGNNIGIGRAKGEFLFIVNNDTEFTPNLIGELIKTFGTHPDAGIVCPKFHYYYNKGVIEYAGYNRVNIFTGRNSMIGHKEKDEGQYNKITSTYYAHGGGMMTSKKVIADAGILPEHFFLYYEELDFSERVRKKGYKIYYQPNALIYHKESMTTGKTSPLKTYYLTRNRILFMKRNMPVAGLGIFFLFFTFFTIPKNTAVYLLKRQKDHLKSFWKGILWHFNKRFTFNS